MDIAAVDDRGGRGAGEAVLPGHEILVADIERARNQPADIDLRARAEQHARGIDDEDLAVGIERAVDDAGLIADDAVQRHRRTAWLVEVDGFLRADREALPIDDGAVGGLIDVRGVAALLDAGGARHDRAASGAGVHGMLQDHQRRDRGHGCKARPHTARGSGGARCDERSGETTALTHYATIPDATTPETRRCQGVNAILT